MAQTPPYQVTDPATGEVTETFPFATDAEVAEALAAATEAFSAWRLRPVAERVAVVKRVAELFTERAADLAALITKEMGKRPAQAVGDRGVHTSPAARGNPVRGVAGQEHPVRTETRGELGGERERADALDAGR